MTAVHPSKERRILVLMALGFGLVGIGRHKVLTGALLLFSLLIGASGLAAGLCGLVLVRLVMGLADGAYTPPSISATLEASPPQRGGINIGLQQMMPPLCGLALAPWLVAQLLPFIGWRWIFVLFSVPGVLLTYAVWQLMPEHIPQQTSRSSFADWKEILGYRNIRPLMVLMLCWLTCLTTTTALMPSYLVDFHRLSGEQMAGIMSVIGLGSTLGTLALPALSDRTGRKPVVVGSALGVAFSLWMLGNAGADPWAQFLWLAVVHFFNDAAITLTVGPIMMATSAGMIIACGEVIGGGLAPDRRGHHRRQVRHTAHPVFTGGRGRRGLPGFAFLNETRWNKSYGK